MMEGQTENVTGPVIIDIVVFLIIGLFDIYVAKIATPFVRGFFCNDESIRYPAISSTVPASVLNIVGISLPLCLIFVLEWKTLRQNQKAVTAYRVFNHKITVYQWTVYKMLTCYGSGALFNQIITDIGKKVIGRLRPNFIDVCRPNLAKVCGEAVNMSTKYIENYDCTNEGVDPNISRVSFPSGHSSFSFYVAVFLVLYIQKKWKTRTILLKPVVQFSLIAVAWFVALSRVMNNKHHWSDVLAGILIGSIVAIINTLVLQKIFLTDEGHAGNAAINGTAVNGAEAHAQL